MAYEGYLVKIGTGNTAYYIPKKYIVMKTYKPILNVQDLDPFRDGKGGLHRNALEHVPPTLEFQIRPGLTNSEYDDIMKGISDNYYIGKELERKCSVTSFQIEKGGYVTADMYLVQPEVTLIREENSTTLIYDAFQMKFVGY